MAGPLAWSAAGGAVATLVIGLWTGWLVTGSTATQLTQRGEQAGMIKLAVPVCMERFQRLPDYPAKLEALVKLGGSWAQTTFVRDGKFSHMMLDGKHEDNYRIGEACAEALAKLAKK